MKILIETGGDPERARLAQEERDLAFRRTLNPAMVTDWESYIGDSLESAGLVDEYRAGWDAARDRYAPKEQL